MRSFFIAAAAVTALACATALAQTNPNTNGASSTANTTNTGANVNGANSTAKAPRAGAKTAETNAPAGANPNGMNPPANAPQAAAATPTPAKPQFINLQSSDMLSSNVVGLNIYNKQNNDIGKIQDVAFNKQKQVTGYILSVGGFLGMGTHYVAVDPDAVAVTYDANNKIWRATMDATKAQLKSAPEFKYGGQWTASRS